MPRFDGTGPMSYGSRTGRGLGPCGSGLGRGCRYGERRFYTKKEESELLQDEAEALGEELKAIKERLSEIKGQN